MAQKRPDRTLGPGHDQFWNWCRQSQLRLQCCAACGHMPWPIVQACEHCGQTELTWKSVSGNGKVISWCRFEHDYYGGTLPIPWDVILVELEEGPLLISNPHGFTCDTSTSGMRVKLAFVECEDTAGTFNLPVFERVEHHH